MAEDIKHVLLILEDKDNIRESLQRDMESAYGSITKNETYSKFVPKEIRTYPGLDELIIGEANSASTYFSWVTDWRLSPEEGADEEAKRTSGVVYAALLSLLGGYATGHEDMVVAAHHTDEENRSAPVFGLEGLNSFRELGDLQALGDNKAKLTALVANSGAFMIYTAHPMDAIFSSSVTAAIDNVGEVGSPLVLYESKGKDQAASARYMALASVLAFSAYEGNLPAIGRINSPPRMQLPVDIAKEFALARKKTIGELPEFLKFFKKRLSI